MEGCHCLCCCCCCALAKQQQQHTQSLSQFTSTACAWAGSGPLKLLLLARTCASQTCTAPEAAIGKALARTMGSQRRESKQTKLQRLTNWRELQWSAKKPHRWPHPKQQHYEQPFSSAICGLRETEDRLAGWLGMGKQLDHANRPTCCCPIARISRFSLKLSAIISATSQRSLLPLKS